MDESRNDMTILNGEVIMWSINVCRDDGCEVASVLLSVGSVHGVNETLCVCISFIGGVRWSIMEHCFINGVCGLVWKDACRQHGD